ncbi:MAG: hypothetical protein U1F35_21220 [Steroidobacteraceae bacterium]
MNVQIGAQRMGWLGCRTVRHPRDHDVRRRTGFVLIAVFAVFIA